MSYPLRVLTIGHSYVVAANRAVAREVARDASLDVTVAAPAFFEGDLRPLKIEPEPSVSPIRVVPVDTYLSRFVHIFRYDNAALSRLIRDGKFDVVHAWEEPYIYAGYQIAAALKSENARFCFRTAQSYVKYYPPPFAFFERKVLKRAQGWIAGATLVHQAMLSRRYPQESGCILNLAVDLGTFKPIPSEARSRVLAGLGLEPPLVGFMGRFTEAKGIDILLNAMDRLLERKWSLLFLGSGERQRVIEAWIAKRALKSRVKVLLAKHDEVPNYLASMDLLLAPSQTMKNWREQFGRMVIEAFACGVPVVGSDSGEIPFVIGDAGRVLPEKNALAWSNCISELLGDHNECRRLVSLGLARAEQFSVTSTAERYRSYYRWLAEQAIPNTSRSYSKPRF